jgi:hypothetical protein
LSSCPLQRPHRIDGRACRRREPWPQFPAGEQSLAIHRADFQSTFQYVIDRYSRSRRLKIRVSVVRIRPQAPRFIEDFRVPQDGSIPRAGPGRGAWRRLPLDRGRACVHDGARAAAASDAGPQVALRESRTKSNNSQYCAAASTLLACEKISKRFKSPRLVQRNVTANPPAGRAALGFLRP